MVGIDLATIMGRTIRKNIREKCLQILDERA